MRRIIPLIAVVILAGGCAFGTVGPDRRISTTAIGQSSVVVDCPKVPSDERCKVTTTGGAISAAMTDLLKAMWELPAAIAKLLAFL